MRAVVAHLGHEEHLQSVARLVDLEEAVVPAVGRVHERVVEIARIDAVPLDPGAEATLLERHVVLGLARPDTVARADALVDVDDHPPPVIGGDVVRCLLGSARDDEVPGERGGARQEDELPGVLQESAAILIHGLRSCYLSLTRQGIFGQCGLWQATHASFFSSPLFL